MTLFGFDVVSRIGTGAASTLYAVSKRGSGQLYVLKHVVIDAEHDERFIDQLKTEFAVGRTFAHPALRRSVEIMDHHTLFTRRMTEAALLLELFDGEPVEMTHIERLPAVLKALAAAARGLDTLHGLGYVHCDIKPDNILVGNHGEGVKIIDFGQTCPIATVKRRVQGSPHYIAPEQFRRDPMMPGADVFNFGATLYRVVTGRTIETVYTRRCNGVPDEPIIVPIEIEPRLPRSLSDLIMRCVSPQPILRPAMREVADALVAIAGAAKTATPSPSRPSPGR